VLAVLAFHFLPDRFRGGYLGVTAFFVLSGYLITGLLVTEHGNHGRVDLKAFYARRALRLYPALVAVVVGVLIVAAVVGYQPTSRSHLYQAGAFSLLYVNDFVLAIGQARHFTGWLDQTWSLGVEEQFYLVWPLLLILALRRFGVPKIGSSCGLVAICIGILLIPLQAALGYYPAYYSPIGSIMPLVLGCGLALVTVRIPRSVAAVACLALLALILRAPDPESASAWHGPEQLAALASAALVGYLITRDLGLMRSRPLVWLGRRSYGVYLIQGGVYWALVNALPNSSNSKYAVIGIPISIALAAASYRWIERQFLPRKRRFSRADPSSAPPRLAVEVS
jgi:peptidoglycan/LPS O-acetylase OafA/YrhL